MSKSVTKRILGIDPGYGRCGFGIIEEKNRDWYCLTHGVITTSKEKGHAARLLEIFEDLRVLIAKYQPTTLVIEELFFAKSTTTALKVAEARGVILLLAEEQGLDIIEVKPNEVKMSVTGYGKAEKQQIQEMVKTLFGFKETPKPDDAADALAVAWCGTGRCNDMREQE
ncbi:MAG: crossover junction endodeoxyribonuclease RuvC [Patescibacteria group bacterium]|nr:crossover junction endodeoxyribonuclease RuvC [Patescibacteria group bacterium]